MVSQLEAGEGAQEVRNPRSERTPFVALAACSGALRRQGSSLGKRPCADFQGVNKLGKHGLLTVRWLHSFKAPPVSNVNNGVLNPPAITSQHCSLNSHSTHSARGSFIGFAVTVSIFQGETDKSKKCPKPKQNTGDRDLKL